MKKYLDMRLPVSMSVGIGLLFAMTLMMLMAAVDYIAGFTPDRMTAIRALLAGFVLTVATSRVRGAAIFLLVIAASVAIAAFMYDSAYDSIYYHKQFVYDLAHGWNPVREVDYTPERIWWIHHYGKFMEINGAAIYMLTGILETASAANTIFAIATSLILYSLLRKLYPQWLTRGRAALAVAVLMCNPVVTAQLFSFYNDIPAYAGVCVMTAAFALLLDPRFDADGMMRRACKGLIICLTLILINVKFTHILYAGLVWIGAGCVMLRRGERARFGRALAGGICVFAIGMFLVGYHPYVTNQLYFGNMFFPILGSEFDSVDSNTTTALRGHCRAVQFVMAHLSQGDSAWSVLLSPADAGNWSIPRGAHTLGFGPLYMLLLILSVILIGVSKPAKWMIWLAVLSVAASFITPISWVARYSPFAWAPAGIAVMASMRAGRRGVMRTIVAVIALMSGSLGFVRNTAVSVSNARRIAMIEKVCADGGSPARVAVENDPVFHYRLAEMQGNFAETSADSLNRSQTYRWYGNRADSLSALIELSPLRVERLRNQGRIDRTMFDLAGNPLR